MVIYATMRFTVNGNVCYHEIHLMVIYATMRFTVNGNAIMRFTECTFNGNVSCMRLCYHRCCITLWSKPFVLSMMTSI